MIAEDFPLLKSVERLPTPPPRTVEEETKIYLSLTQMENMPPFDPKTVPQLENWVDIATRLVRSRDPSLVTFRRLWQSVTAPNCEAIVNEMVSKRFETLEECVSFIAERRFSGSRHRRELEIELYSAAPKNSSDEAIQWLTHTFTRYNRLCHRAGIEVTYEEPIVANLLLDALPPAVSQRCRDAELSSVEDIIVNAVKYEANIMLSNPAAVANYPAAQAEETPIRQVYESMVDAPSPANQSAQQSAAVAQRTPVPRSPCPCWPLETRL